MLVPVIADVTLAVPDMVILPMPLFATAMPVVAETVPPEMVTVPVEFDTVASAKLDPVLETVPPEMATAPVEALDTALPVVAETVPPEMVTVPVEPLYTASPLAVFAISALLLAETELRISMVLLPLPVIFPVSVSALQFPLKLAEAEPMSNVVLLPNCMLQFLPAA